MSNERRQITPEQGERLMLMLEEKYGPPKVDEVTVDDQGAITSKETWGDEVSTTMRRTPLHGNKE